MIIAIKDNNLFKTNLTKNKMDFAIQKLSGKDLETITNPFHEFFNECIEKAIERAEYLWINNRQTAERFYGVNLRTNCSFLKKIFGKRKKPSESFEKFIPENFDKVKNEYNKENIFIGDSRIAVVGWGVNIMEQGIFPKKLDKIENYQNIHPIEKLLRTYMNLKTTEFSTWGQKWPLDSLTMPVCPFEVPSVGILVGLYETPDKKIEETKKIELEQLR